MLETQADILDCQSTLQAACINAISPDDVSQVIAKQVTYAKEGDVKSANFLMSLIRSNHAVKVNQTNIVTAPRME